MNRNNKKPTVVVVGPARSTGGMASVMRLQLSSDLKNRYRLLPFDNSKKTPAGRSLWQGMSAQVGLLYDLSKVLRKWRPPIVHIHTCSPPTFYRSVLDALLVKLYHGHVILHIHGGHFAEFLEHSGAMHSWWIRRALRSVDQIVVLSEAWSGHVHAFDEALEPAVVYNGVSLPQRAKSWRPTQRKRIVFVGDLRAVKGVDDLIMAVAKLPKRIREVTQLRIIGPQRSREVAELEALAEDAGLDGRVHIAGALPPAHVQRELRQATVFALPSYYEGLPMALLEAMAYGVPCVATKVGAIPEVMQHGVEGLLVEPGAVDQLTKSLKKLLDNPELCRELGKAARQKVRLQFSHQQAAEAVDRLYAQALAPAGNLTC